MSRQMKLSASITTAAGLLLAAAGTSHAQMSRSVLESLAVRPPAHAFNHTASSFTYVGNFDLWVGQDYAVNAANENPNDPQNVAYVKYVAPLGSTVNVSAYFLKTVPPPTASTDACPHAHLEFAVYALQKTSFGFFTSTRVMFVASTGKYGRRIKNGVEVPSSTAGAACEVSADPETIYPSTSKSFIWGKNSYDMLFIALGPSKFTEYYVPAQAATHGWGDCGHFQCYPEILYAANRTK